MANDEEKRASAHALRERYDVDSRTIRRLRANQNMTTDTLNKLCAILDCTLDGWPAACRSPRALTAAERFWAAVAHMVTVETRAKVRIAKRVPRLRVRQGAQERPCEQEERGWSDCNASAL